MTAEQEVELARAIRREVGEARDAVRHTPVEPILSRGHTKRERTRGNATDRVGCAVDALAELASRDASYHDLARRARTHWRKSVRLTWRLALSAIPVVRREAHRYGAPSIDTDDLEQHGYLGLLRAARRFEAGKNVRFTTYARWWVRTEIQKAADRSSVVRLPKSAARSLQRLRAGLDRNGRDTPVTVAQAARAAGVSPQRAHYLLGLSLPQSLTRRREGGVEVVPLEDTSTPDPSEQAATRERIAQLRDALEQALDPRSRDVLRRRYGLDGSPPETLAAIGERYGVTPQRIRQLQRRAERRVGKWLEASLGRDTSHP